MSTQRSTFGWLGVAALFALCVFTFDSSQRALTWLPNRISTPMLIVSMIASVFCPLIEAFRSSKRWVFISLVGLTVTLRFFWMLAD